MARQRKATAQASDPTEFDPAKLEREPGDDSAVSASERAAEAIAHVSRATEMPQEHAAGHHHGNGPSHTAGVEKKQFKRAKDPFDHHTINLSPDPKGPKAQLLRSNDHEAMLIQFSENPGKEITDQIKDAGFHWESRAQSDFAKGAWIIKLEPGNEWRNHAHAEKVFQQMVNQIREKTGMDPFVPGAGQCVS